MKKNKQNLNKIKEENVDIANQADDPSLKEMTEVIGNFLNWGIPEAIYSSYTKLDHHSLIELK